MIEEMTTKEAVSHLIGQGYTKYRIAKLLDLAGAVSINQYLRGTRMTAGPALKMLTVFKIKVTDVYIR